MKEFPSAKINPTLLRRVYRLHGIKKKTIRWVKTAKQHGEGSYRQKFGTMKMLLTKAKNQGFRFIYLDETCFTRKTCQLAEWARKGENVQFDQSKLNEPTIALLCGISKERGIEHHEQFDLSVNIDKFKQYCQNLRAKNEGEKICLFMDNLSVHISKKSKTEMRRLGFRFIYNIPYEPE